MYECVTFFNGESELHVNPLMVAMVEPDELAPTLRSKLIIFGRAVKVRGPVELVTRALGWNLHGPRIRCGDEASKLCEEKLMTDESFKPEDFRPEGFRPRRFTEEVITPSTEVKPAEGEKTLDIDGLGDV